MTSFRIRPKFRTTSPIKQQTIIARLQEALQEQPPQCHGIAIEGHIILKVLPDNAHYWSPQLSILLDQEEEETLIRGRYGPKPNVWTLFTMSYLAISILSIFISIIGFSRLSLGLSAGILWILPILGIAAIGLYIISQLGQKLGAEQTFTLHHFFEEIIDQKIPLS